MSDILVVGLLNADLVVRTPLFPAPGETISGEDLATILGGKGVEQEDYFDHDTDFNPFAA